MGVILNTAIGILHTPGCHVPSYLQVEPFAIWSSHGEKQPFLARVVDRRDEWRIRCTQCGKEAPWRGDAVLSRERLEGLPVVDAPAVIDSIARVRDALDSWSGEWPPTQEALSEALGIGERRLRQVLAAAKTSWAAEITAAASRAPEPG